MGLVVLDVVMGLDAGSVLLERRQVVVVEEVVVMVVPWVEAVPVVWVLGTAGVGWVAVAGHLC